MGVDAGLMKRLNKRQIRSVMQSCKAATKPEIASMTGLSVVTVNSLLSEFVKTGEVVESGMAPSGGGRPGRCYCYRSDYRCAALLYGHQQNDRNLIHIRVVDLYGACLWRRDEYYDEITVDCFEPVLDEAIGLYPQIGLIAFGLPGEAVDGVITICDYTQLLGEDFLRRSRERYRVPVVFENDINAMTYGACDKNHMPGDGAGKDFGRDLQGKTEAETEEESVAGIYFPRIYPPGAGLVLNGRIHYGAGHFAGEMAELPVPVPWDKLDYHDEAQVLSVMKAVIAIFCCTTAPERLVLYGDFFSQKMEEQLQSFGAGFLKGRYRVAVDLRKNVEKDYEAGMIRRALEELSEQMD